MPGDDHVDFRRYRVQVETFNVVDEIKHSPPDLNKFCVRQGRPRKRGIHVSPDIIHRRNFPQCLQYVFSSDVSGVKNCVDVGKNVLNFITDHAVCIGKNPDPGGGIRVCNICNFHRVSVIVPFDAVVCVSRSVDSLFDSPALNRKNNNNILNHIGFF